MDVWIPKLVWGALMIAAQAIRIPHQRRNRQNRIVMHRITLTEVILVGGVALGMVLLPLASVATPWLRFADYTPSPALPICGLLLAAPTLWLFGRSHADLGRNWSGTLAVHDDHTLITHGVYSFIRHPMYVASWLWVMMQALLLPNYIGGLSGLVSFGLLYFVRVGEEEAMMRQQFGASYDEYAARTGRILPRWKELGRRA